MPTAATATISSIDLAITFLAGDFMAAHSGISGAIPTKSPKLILQNALLIIPPDASSPCELQATDLEIAATRKFRRIAMLGFDESSDDEAGDDQPNGSTQLGGRAIIPTYLINALSKLPKDAQITFEIDRESEKIRAMCDHLGFTAELPSEDASLFPTMDDYSKFEPFAEFDGAELQRAIGQTIYATDVESTRYALGGCLFERSEESSANQVNIVATDGRRLVKKTLQSADLEGVSSAKSPANPVVPVKLLKLVASAIDPKSEQSITMRWLPGSAVLFSQSGWSLYGRLVEGRFPRYQDVFPQPNERRVCVSFLNEQMRDALETVAAITSTEDSRGLDLEFQPNGNLLIKGSAADRGKASRPVSLDYEDGVGVPSESVIDGQPLRVTFDPRYLIDILSKKGPERLTMDVIDHKNAVVFRAEDEGIEAVVMPLTRDY